MKAIFGDKANENEAYYRVNDVTPALKELDQLRDQLVMKNDFVACCNAIDRIPGVSQSFVAWQSRMDEKRIAKMSGTWDTGIARRMDYRVVLWGAKGGCVEFTDPSLRVAVAKCCELLHVPFPEELE